MMDGGCFVGLLDCRNIYRYRERRERGGGRQCLSARLSCVDGVSVLYRCFEREMG